MGTKRILLASLAMALALTSGVVDAQSTNGEPPGAPREFRVESDRSGGLVWMWTRSTDDTGIREYRFYVNGRPLLTVDPSERSATLPLRHGIRYVQMDAVDLDGNTSVKTAPIRVRIDTAPPSAPVEVTAEASYISATTRVLIRFELPNPGDVSFCTLLRTLGPSKTGNFVPQPDPADPTRFRVVEWFPPPGDAWFQIVCEDGAGNRSVRSAPAFVNILAF